MKSVENLDKGVNKEDLKFYRKRILQQQKIIYGRSFRQFCR